MVVSEKKPPAYYSNLSLKLVKFIHKYKTKLKRLVTDQHSSFDSDKVEKFIILTCPMLQNFFDSSLME
jgi:hypothetical protein